MKQLRNPIYRLILRRTPRRKPLRKHHSGMPGSRWRRCLWYMNPKRLFDFWFTEEGLRKLGKIALVGGGASFGFIVILFLWFAKDLPNPGQINARFLKQTTQFYDRTGTVLLYEVFGEENREVKDLGEISDHLEHATIAIEDKNFYKQGAFSFVGIIRAAVNNVLNREGAVQGGSSITQQYVKNALLSPERTYTRKVKELILAIQIEQLYDKDDILELYLNEIPYGTLAYGAQAGSETFFSKDAKDLTIDEAALLAALPQAPTYYSPYGQNIEALMGRWQSVIHAMHDQGYISAEERDAALAVDIMAKVNDNPNLYRNIKAPHFVLTAQDILVEKYGLKQVTEGGLKVITSVDMRLQQIAEEAVANNMGAVERGNGDNTALVAADPRNGHVLAMVGSRDFNYPGYGSFNAALAGRQPGSSFKPYSYATLFKSSEWGPGSTIYDVSTSFSEYKPNNFDFRFRGVMSVRTALGESRNIPAVKALYIAGIDNVIEQAHKQGITTLNDGPGAYGLSLTLGAGEVKLADHVNGYSAFANGGIHHDQVYILKVTDGKGDLVEEWKQNSGERVLDEQIAYLMTNMLSDDVARAGTFGRNNRNVVVPGITMAAKTGTTDLSRDGWMMGYTMQIVAGVWVGNHDNRPMHSITSNQTGPIWTEFMRRAHEGLEDIPFPRPEGIKEIELDAETGKLPNAATRTRRKDVFPSWYKPKENNAVKYTADKVSGKLATDCTPPLAKEERTSGGVDAEIPPTDPMYNQWIAGVRALGLSTGASKPTESDDVHKCSDPKPEVLSITVSNAGLVKATFKAGNHFIQTVNFKVDGQIFSTQSVNLTGTNTLEAQASVAPGSHTFLVEVIDSVLYSDDATEPHTTTSSGSFSNTSPGASVCIPGAGNQSVSFSWTAGGAGVSYQLYINGSPSGTPVNGLSTSASLGGSLGGTNYDWYVKETSSGQTTGQTSFKRKITCP